MRGIDIDDRKKQKNGCSTKTWPLREEIERSSMFEEIVGSSEALRHVLAQVSKVRRRIPQCSSRRDGTGKELIARAIHNRSNRSKRAFIRVNCAAIPASLIAPSCSVHEKRLLHGASQRRLDALNQPMEARFSWTKSANCRGDTMALLRVLQEREFERVGGNQSISVDVRGGCRDQSRFERSRGFGQVPQDLFYRLNVFPISNSSSARARRRYLPAGGEYLIDRYGKKTGKKFRI